MLVFYFFIWLLQAKIHSGCKWQNIWNCSLSKCWCIDCCIKYWLGLYYKSFSRWRSAWIFTRYGNAQSDRSDRWKVSGPLIRNNFYWSQREDCYGKGWKYAKVGFQINSKRTRSPIDCEYSTLKRHLVNRHLKTVLSDELECNNIGLDADQILDQLNLVTFENSKSISESLILYLRKTIYHLSGIQALVDLDFCRCKNHMSGSPLLTTNYKKK